MSWCFLPLALVLSAQTPSSASAPALQAPAEQAPILKVTTRLVQVSVIVHDKKGQPAAGLSRDDFILLDKGREQQVRYFSMETNRQPETPPALLPPGVFSNRAASGDTNRAGMPTSLTVILLDGLNTRIQDQYSARRHLIKFLEQIQPSDRVAIYTLGNGLRVLHDFTSDTASLLRALTRYKDRQSVHEAASVPEEPAPIGEDEASRQLEEFLRQADERIANFYTARRVEMTLKALETISNHLAGMSGRKNLVWLSSGFPLFVGANPDGSTTNDYQHFSEEMQRAVRALNSANLAIYPVGARGLIGTFDMMPSMSPSYRGRQTMGINPADMRAAASILDTHATMREVAGRTGGRAFLNTNDISGAIRSAIDDTRVTYLLSYTPDHGEWDGKFREIKVRVKRPGLEVRARKGYFAWPEDPQSPKLRRASLAIAANGPLESNGLGMKVMLVEAPAPGKGRFQLKVILETKEVAFEQNEKGIRIAVLDLMLVFRDAEGATLANVSRTLRVSVAPEDYQKFLETGIGLNAGSEAPPKSSRLRVAARDMGSGLVGSVDLPLVR